MSTKHIKFDAMAREQAGKGNARATRREGRVPAVIYGDKKAPVTISLETKEVVKQLNTGHLFTHICDVAVGKESHKVLARDVQFHPVKDMPMHVDFLRVTDKTKIAVEVPVNFLNEEECKGIKQGGILNIVRRTVEVNCLANAIPEELTFDLTNIDIDESIKISEFDLPKGVEPTVTDRDFTVATIAVPRAVVEEEDTEEADMDPADVPATEQGGSDEEGDDASDDKEGGE